MERMFAFYQNRRGMKTIVPSFCTLFFGTLSPRRHGEHGAGISHGWDRDEHGFSDGDRTTEGHRGGAGRGDGVLSPDGTGMNGDSRGSRWSVVGIRARTGAQRACSIG